MDGFQSAATMWPGASAGLRTAGLETRTGRGLVVDLRTSGRRKVAAS